MRRGWRGMSNFRGAGRIDFRRRRQGAGVTDEDVSDWFVREIVPLEPILMHYLHHNWKNASDLSDLRQEVYTRVFEAARAQFPENAKRFLLATARNLLIDLVRREHVVPIEAVADLESLEIAVDAPGPDRVTVAHDEFRRLQAAVEKLSPRLREAFRLAYVEGLTGQEIARRMGVTKSAASKYLAHGLRALTNILNAEAEGRKP